MHSDARFGILLTHKSLERLRVHSTGILVPKSLYTFSIRMEQVLVAIDYHSLRL